MATDHETKEQASLEAPFRVVRPVVPLWGMLALLGLVGFVAAIVAIVLAFVASLTGAPFLPVFVTVLLLGEGAFFVRTLLGQRAARFMLYPDRLVGHWPHPRKVRLEMQEKTVRPAAVIHLQRRGKSFQLAERGSGSIQRIDVASRGEADAFWTDLLAWRERDGGPYSFSGTEDELRYSSEAELAEVLGASRATQELRVERDDAFTHWIRGEGVEVKVEDLGGPGEGLKLTWQGGPVLRIWNPISGASSRGTISTPEGLVLASWRRLGPGQAQLVLGGRKVELMHEVLSEDGVGIAQLTFSWGFLQKVRFLSESTHSAVLLSLLALLPSVTYERRKSASRARRTP